MLLLITEVVDSPYTYYSSSYVEVRIQNFDVIRDELVMIYMHGLI